MKKILIGIVTCCLFTISFSGNVFALDGTGEDPGYTPNDPPGTKIPDDFTIDTTYRVEPRPSNLPSTFTEHHLLRGNLVDSRWTSDGLSYYKQHDYPYIGYGGTNCSDDIASSGCALTALASVVSRYGKNYDPPALNNYLGASAFSGCLLNWITAASRLSLSYQKDDFSPNYYESTAKLKMQERIQKGYSPIVSLKCSSGHQAYCEAPTHYVINYGYETYWNDDGTGYTTYHYLHNPGGANKNEINQYMDHYYIVSLHNYGY
ncbi:MAG: C39 family peptidase [Bacilli bacterium]